MELGIVKGFKITKNRDGTQDKLLLQVEIIPGDVRTVEFMGEAGNDTNPAIGSRVIVITPAKGYQIAISSTDDLTPEVDSGEKELYSTDGSSKLAKLKLNLDSEIELNGNADYAVSYNDLNTILTQLVNNINTIFVTAADGAVYGGGLTIDLSSAKVDKVRLP
jgi:hypothetical protein